MKSVKGDLIKMAIDGDFDIIIHGCNCFNVMGSGIAKTIKDMFPEVYQDDLETIKGDKRKLGIISPVMVSHNNRKFVIVNAYTQYKYGMGINVSYDAIRSCFKHVYNEFSIYKDWKIGYPMIGCGLGGGDWNIVSKIIDEELKDLDHTLVIYKGK